MKSIKTLFEAFSALAILFFGLIIMTMFFSLPLIPIYWLLVGFDSEKYEQVETYSFVCGIVLTLSLLIEGIFILPYPDLELTFVWRQVTALHEIGIYIPLFAIGIIILYLRRT